MKNKGKNYDVTFSIPEDAKPVVTADIIFTILNCVKRNLSGDRIPVGARFSHLSRPALGPTQPPVNGYRFFSGDKLRPERDADLPPLLVPRSKIE
jgi:hypothetical protein